MKQLIIIGAGGFGREVAWLVERINARKHTWELLGFLDDSEENQGIEINGYRILGKIEAVKDYPDAYFVVAIGTAIVREQIVNRMKMLNPQVKFGTVIDPSVEMSDYVTVGEGTIICAHTLITVNILIGQHVIINLDCTVGHDAVLEDFTTLYPSVNVSGATHIGHATELGTGMQMIQGKRIGDYSCVGAGAVVVQDIPSGCTAVGCPARVIKSHGAASS